MIAFKRNSIGSIGRIVTGKTPPTDNSQNYGIDYMFIGPADLNKHFIIEESEKMISTQGLQTIKGCTLNGLSILVGCIGWDMGNVALVEGTCATNQQINSITDVKPDFNPYYVYYWLKGKKQFLFQQASVTRTPILNKSDFSNIEIPTPEKNYQDRVVQILRPIDIKIELNNRINAELEAMAKTIYNYWFVQFDFPNKNGKPYKASGGKMVWNEELKREIPEGWEVGTLLDIADFTNGIACQKFRPNNDEPSYRVIKIREMSGGFSDSSEFVSRHIPNKVLVNNGDILFSWSATLDVKIWSGGIGALNQHIFKVTSIKYPRSYFYFEVLQYLQHFKMMAELRKTTMGHITQDHLRQSRIVIPPLDLVESIHKIIDPILNKTVLGNEKNQKLTELRDWLLPMLMNGQIKIKDAEQELAMAAEPTINYKVKSNV